MRTKVFVGNLSFATKENELAKEFEGAGKVISANIITRGPRSLGYGFVEMDNEQDAENAVKLLDKKEIDGRPINVEVAKLREEGAENAERPQGGSRGGRGGRGGRGSFRGSRGGAPRGAPRGGAVNGGDQGRRRFRQRVDEGEEGSQQNQQQQGEGQQNQGEGRRGGRGRGRGGRGGQRGDRPPRPQRDEKREDNRAPSQTTLFVANLPFTLDDEGFSKIFKDNSLAYKSAHVVKKRSGRSKGFGFVEFDNEGDQQKALASINNKQVEGRELVVKVALTENKPEEGTANATATTTTTAQTTDAKTSTPKTETKATTASPKVEQK